MADVFVDRCVVAKHLVLNEMKAVIKSCHFANIERKDSVNTKVMTQANPLD